MGDRISISFKNGNDESVALFSHWGGRGFLNKALKYVRQLKEKIRERQEDPKSISHPIDRLEPETVMVDFIRDLTKEEKLIEGDLYLGKDSWNGDNSDNGHFIIDLPTEEIC